jgi:hypothetical protein
MARADDYRRYAAECLALAQRAANPQDRTRLLEMANAWNQMAAKSDARSPSEDDSSDSALPWKPRE